MKGNVTLLELSRIRAEADTHARLRLNLDYVEELREELANEVTLPPVVVFFDGGSYHLADGFHRFHAYKRAGRSHIECVVRQGTVRDARMNAAGSNQRHGLRRSTEDRRRAVSIVLADEVGKTWSAAAVAKHCGVGHDMVASVREINRILGEDAERRRKREQA